VSSLSFSVDGRALISVSRDKTVKLWDVQTGKFLRTVSGEKDQIVTLAVSRNGRVMATGTIGRDISLMAYPLKVLLAPTTGAKKAPDEVAVTPNADANLPLEKPAASEPELDMAALAESNTDGPSLAYKDLNENDPTALLETAKILNDLLAKRDYCKDFRDIDKLAHQVLVLAPGERAAYFALVVTGIVQQDIKMIYLMSKIGLQAQFSTDIYTFDLPQAVEQQLLLWQNTVFNPSRSRAGRSLELQIENCKGERQVLSMPSALLHLDLPGEVLQVLSSKTTRINYSLFKGLDDQTFLNRLYFLMDEALVAARKSTTENSGIKIDLEKAPLVQLGAATINLIAVDAFGAPDNVPFRIRRERGPWNTYTSDADRQKTLLLPVGHYYLMLNQKVRKVFTLSTGKETPVLVD